MAASTSTVLTAAGLNIAVTGVVAAMAYTVMTNQWSTAQVLGQHTAAIGTLLDEIRDIKRSVVGLREKAATIETQLRVAQTDVVTLLADAGFPIDKNVKIVWVGEQFVLFPQTQAASDYLREQKFTPVQLTPSIAGFALDSRSANIVKAVVDNAASTKPPVVPDVSDGGNTKVEPQ
jgi:hypothetical protein